MRFLRRLAEVVTTAALVFTSLTGTGVLAAHAAPSPWAACPSSVPGPSYGVLVKGQYGTCVHYTAQVYQFDTVTGNKGLLVAITNDGFGVWTDLVWLNLASASLGTTITDNDVVYLVGRLEGTYTYTTQLGGTNTVPVIDVTQLRLANAKTVKPAPGRPEGSAAPVISSFTATPNHLSASGGTVVLSATVAHATSCRLTGQTVRPVACASGKVRTVDRVKANTTGATRVMRVSLVATGPGGTVSRSVSVSQVPATKPVISSFTATPNHLSASGGTVVLSATVAHATSCRLTGQTVRPVACASGKVRTVDRVKANTTGATRVVRVSLVATGPGGTVSRSVSVSQVAAISQPTTTQPTTATTQPTPPTTAQQSNVCAGPCKFTFPSADADGFVSVTLNQIRQNVPCPDPGLCDATGNQQVDDANLTVCAGPSGASNGPDLGNFSLALSDGTQASQDSVSYDSSVPGAFGTYGAVAPGQCVTGDLYFDAALGTQWTSLNFAYTSADYSTQTVYAWQA